jgi:hypothetical protein
MVYLEGDRSPEMGGTSVKVCTSRAGPKFDRMGLRAIMYNLRLQKNISVLEGIGKRNVPYDGE